MSTISGRKIFTGIIEAFLGYSIATAFTVTGAVVGVGLGLGGDPAWSKHQQVTGLWIVVPIVGGTSAYVLARYLRDDSISDRFSISLLAAVLGMILSNIQFSVLAPGGDTRSLSLAIMQSVNGGTATRIGVQFRDALELLFDLSSDPFENENLIGSDSENVQSALTQLREYVSNTLDFDETDRKRKQDERMAEEHRLPTPKGGQTNTTLLMGELSMQTPL